MSQVTQRFKRYVLRVVANGHYVTHLQMPRDRQGMPSLEFFGEAVPIERAKSFWGGPWLNKVLAEAEDGHMDLFPILVDR